MSEDHLLRINPKTARILDDDDDFLLIGVDMNGEAKAYSISSLTGVEVVNEHFGNDYVAVAY